MDIRQLRYFLIIAEEGQISRAAKKLHMAQPPLSQQLRLMEEEIGTVLLERKRNGKTMELTEAGEILYKKARNILNLFEESILEVKEAGEGIRGSLSIGIVVSCVSYLPKRIQYLHENYPMISFKLRGGDPVELSKQLENRNIELAIVRLPLEMEGLSMIPLETESFVFVVPKDWGDFHSKEAIQMKEIEDVPLLLVHRTKGEGLYERIIEECERFEFQPNILCECPDINILLSLVEAGIGASILPKSAVSAFRNIGIRVLDILDSSLQSEIALVWLKQRYLSKAARRFIELF
ncbi:LysR family transcriptional regulator [Bacillus sp. 3103sda1]|uniref:LysR family transcriptional regulator n=1 Tax=Bacillus sp. 3103sda1 TaxID=2953808 RepID=UPI00209D7D06|nr:LysR family transcriptional regulator [Bacillus sp. 3103sda1]MCP1121999.1 LysR family transcriptional regulator [Bacillus sp. 3103sda1]